MGRALMLEYLPGATPLDPDEANGLLVGHITTQNQLNEWEQMNILAAEKLICSDRYYYCSDRRGAPLWPPAGFAC